MLKCKNSSRTHSCCLATVVFLTGTLSNPAHACMPEQPIPLLMQGDGAVLASPQGSFAAELARMNLKRPRAYAVPPDKPDAYTSQSVEMDLADLRKALKQNKTPEEDINSICASHEEQRRILAARIDSKHGWYSSPYRPGFVPQQPSNNDQEQTQSSDQQANLHQPPAFNIVVVDGLPNEFADYFEGFVAWHNPAVTDKQVARAHWERLLDRKST